MNISIKNKNEIKEKELNYRKSFVDDEEFEGKRFNRYISKIEDFILEEYLRKAYPDFFDNVKFLISVNDLTSFIIKLFQVYYLYEMDKYKGTDSKRDKSKEILFLGIHEYAMPNLDVFTNNALFEKYLLNPCFSKTSPHTLESFVKYETRKVCKEFIRRKLVEMENINEDNYFKTLPTTLLDAILIFDNILNYVKIDVENFMKSNTPHNLLEIQKDDKITDLINEKNALNDVINELNNEISLKNEEIKGLNNLISDKENKNIKEDELKDLLLEQLSTLKRQNLKIIEKYNKLFDKYNELKKNIKESEQNLDLKEDTSVFKEINFNERFLFVASEDISFQQSILNVFPNATFCNSNISLNNSNVYMVIVLITHIDHSTYYGIKEQCKNKNIPLVHCKYSNIELIKELIWNYINI